MKSTGKSDIEYIDMKLTNNIDIGVDHLLFYFIFFSLTDS